MENWVALKNTVLQGEEGDCPALKSELQECQAQWDLRSSSEWGRKLELLLAAHFSRNARTPSGDRATGDGVESVKMAITANGALFDQAVEGVGDEIVLCYQRNGWDRVRAERIVEVAVVDGFKGKEGSPEDPLLTATGLSPTVYLYLCNV